MLQSPVLQSQGAAAQAAARAEAVLYSQDKAAEVSAQSPARDVRLAAREGRLAQFTSGLALGCVQANLVALPQEWAFDFLLFCQRNPKPCPLLEVVEAGQWEPRRFAPGADVRTDVPRYRVWREGTLAEERQEVASLWREDLVTFLLGCSFSFERLLQQAGLAVRHIDLGRNVPMYRTSIPCRPAGVFRGPMVVSMRPYLPEEAIQAALISSRLPQVHGAPIHQGDAAKIGIADLMRPDYGEAPQLRAGELPVFWACGVTPQAVLLQAKLPFAITHSPGCMFVSDIREDGLSALGESIRN